MPTSSHFWTCEKYLSVESVGSRRMHLQRSFRSPAFSITILNGWDRQRLFDTRSEKHEITQRFFGVLLATFASHWLLINLKTLFSWPVRSAAVSCAVAKTGSSATEDVSLMRC